VQAFSSGPCEALAASGRARSIRFTLGQAPFRIGELGLQPVVQHIFRGEAARFRQKICIGCYPVPTRLRLFPDIAMRFVFPGAGFLIGLFAMMYLQIFLSIDIRMVNTSV